MSLAEAWGMDESDLRLWVALSANGSRRAGLWVAAQKCRSGELCVAAALLEAINKGNIK